MRRDVPPELFSSVTAMWLFCFSHLLMMEGKKPIKRSVISKDNPRRALWEDSRPGAFLSTCLLPLDAGWKDRTAQEPAVKGNLSSSQASARLSFATQQAGAASISACWLQPETPAGIKDLENFHLVVEKIWCNYFSVCFMILHIHSGWLFGLEIIVICNALGGLWPWNSSSYNSAWYDCQ